MHKNLNNTHLWLLRHSIAILISVSFLFSGNAFGQLITSVEPSSLYPGETHTPIKITGMGTAFANGKTTVDMGPYITLSNIVVQNTATIQAIADVSPTAPAGSYNVTVTTKTNNGNKVVVQPGGVTIVSLGGPVRATILVNPVQSINLADFNPTSIADAPLLFTVTVYNSNIVQNLTVVVTLTGAKLGLLATGTKKFKSVAPDAVETVDDRQFDKYTVANINQAAIQQAIQTGNIPSDVYTYDVKVLNDSGRAIATASGVNVLTDQENKPELMTPGNPMYSDPPLVNTRYPVFQWFSKANSFNFNLFEVKPGQISAPEVIINRPIFVQQYFNNTSLVYPAGAAMLEEGHTYAWQIVANYSTSGGSTTVPSDLFWFTVATTPYTAKTQTISDLRVVPAEIKLNAGQSYKFTVKSLDIQNDTLHVKPEWNVVPAEAGTVDSLGNFTAGMHARKVAVIASYKGESDYSTVDIIDPADKTGDQDKVRPKKADPDFNPRLK